MMLDLVLLIVCLALVLFGTAFWLLSIRASRQPTGSLTPQQYSREMIDLLRRNTVVIAVLCLILLSPLRASAHFIDGYLAECTAVAAGQCTEVTATGYARQPVFFNNAVKGVAPLGSSFFFGPASAGTIAGRAIFDAPTGGNLVLVLPLATPLVIGTQGDNGDVGALKPTFTALVNLQAGELLNTTMLAGSTIGTTLDGSAITAGVNLTLFRGILSPAVPDGDNSYRQVPQVTGFSYQIPNGVSTVDIGGTGTLATGTLLLQLAPADGSRQVILCDVTVTALTLTPNTGQTAVGTLPSTCGANASHELRFMGANRTWHVLY